MSRRAPFLFLPLLCLPLGLALADDDPGALAALDALADDDEQDDEDEEDQDAGATRSSRTIHYKPKTEIDFEDLSIDGSLSRPSSSMAPRRAGSTSMSATAGGAQDAGFMDRELDADIIPRPEHFTAEGILSEHDLPVADDVDCEALLCVAGQAVVLDRRQRLLAQPEVDAVAQLGFTSGLDASEWERPALNLVAVVDRSGSMEGEPLGTTKAALRLLVRRLEEGDRMSIVSFDNQVDVLVRDGDERELMRAIDGLQAGRSTCIECGLERGMEVAQHVGERFEGQSRVVLFTDERPNVGTTSAPAFMGQLERMADAGVGVTTIGVASHFGVELAQAVSTVRGANLFYFEDLSEMRRVFDEELDTMLVPMAYDMELVVEPSDGWSLAGVYGLPGEALEWTRRGGIRLNVATLFPSRDKGGGIFLGFERDGEPASGEGALARARVSYTTLDGKEPASRLSMPLVELERASLGLQRGVVLVDTITTLKAATVAYHHQDDATQAWRLVAELETRLDRQEDATLEPEWERAAELLGLLEPHVDPADRRISRRDPVSGLPTR